MRSIAIRHKSRDVRLIGILFIAACLFTDSAWNTSPLIDNALLLSGIVFVSVAALLRAWSILYIAGYKQKYLITQGPFSICRNPIYLSTVLGFFGISLNTGTFTYPALALAAFLAYFYAQVKAEEAKLLQLHGDRFRAYCARTPRLIPNFDLLDEPAEYTVQPAQFRRWLADAVWFFWGLGIIQFASELHEIGVLPVLFRIY
jgi:protein-S-isoprenylcysteine O-methyltransferase Ste14